MDRKRQRISSGSTVLTALTVTQNLHVYGELILHCDVRITKRIHECGNALVLKNVCALLNSGGGILHMRNRDSQSDHTMSKHLDTWWSGMECKLVDIISRDDICNYFDLVGNYDDIDLYLFVKTAEHLSTLDFNARLPTDTATHDVTYQSVIKLLTNSTATGSLDDLPVIPDLFVYGKLAEDLKKETKQIQFKLLTSGPLGRDKTTLAEKVRNNMLRYVSAFANHEGGHIFFGIEDERAAVYGEDVSLTEQKRIEKVVHNRMQKIIWKDESIRPRRGKQWNIRFYPVHNSPDQVRRLVIVVSVCKFPGGVFLSCPECYYSNVEGVVTQFTYNGWKEAILNPFRDVPELHNRFIKIAAHVPMSPLIFTLPQTMQTIREKILLGAKDSKIQPRHFLDNFVPVEQREQVELILDCITKGENCFCVGAECWGMKTPFSYVGGVLCDLLLVSEADGLHLITFCWEVSPQVMEHSQIVAAGLKNKLVQNGGCAEKFGLLCQCIDLSVPLSDMPYGFRLNGGATSDVYPSHFAMNRKKFAKIIDSIIVTMAAYSQHAPVLKHGSFNFLLTRDQFELLWTQQFTKELWVHGPPGSGKTVAAVQMIEELRRRGCEEDEILYLAENRKLCNFVRHHGICSVVTRRELMEDQKDPKTFQTKYENICNVIVDEVQNFKDWDGDWYSLAEKLANQRSPEHLRLCCNYFWVFMDYSQKVHKFKAGLPSVIGKNNFMLSQVSRNTKEIFDFTTRFMSASEDVDPYIHGASLQRVQSIPTLAHKFSSGHGVDILSCREAEIKSMLEKVLEGLIKSGVTENDIAILVGKRSQLDKLQDTVRDLKVTSEEGPCSDKLRRNTPGSGKWDVTIDTDKVSSLVEEGRDVTDGPQESSDVQDATSSFYLNKSTDYPETKKALFSLDPVPPFEPASITESLQDKTSEDLLSVGGGASWDSQSDDGKYINGIDDDDKSGDISADEEMEDNDNDNSDNMDNMDTAETDGFAVDTVRRFSGLDKPVVIGINPDVNEEHADFNRFIVSLASRARDNLVIITTSDKVKNKLEKPVDQQSQLQ